MANLMALSAMGEEKFQSMEDFDRSQVDWVLKALAFLQSSGPQYSNQIAVHMRQTLAVTDGFVARAIKREMLAELPDGRVCTVQQFTEFQNSARKPAKVSPIRYCNSNTGRIYEGVYMGTPRDLSLGSVHRN